MISAQTLEQAGVRLGHKECHVTSSGVWNRLSIAANPAAVLYGLVIDRDISKEQFLEVLKMANATFRGCYESHRSR